MSVLIKYDGIVYDVYGDGSTVDRLKLNLILRY